MAHEIMVFPVPLSHFDFMLVREHADLLNALMRSPDNQRYLVPNGRLHRKYCIPRKNRPVNTSKAPQGALSDLLHRNGVDILIKNVTVEPDSQICKIVNT